MSEFVPLSARITAPLLDGTEEWLDPDGRDTTTYAEIEARWMVDARTADRIYWLRLLPYEDYLRSPHWQAIRIEVQKRQDGRCEFCNGCIRDVHHRGPEAYRRKGFERDEDVVGLCRGCHEIEHDSLVAVLREEIRNMQQ